MTLMIWLIMTMLILVIIVVMGSEVSYCFTCNLVNMNIMFLMLKLNRKVEHHVTVKRELKEQNSLHHQLNRNMNVNMHMDMVSGINRPLLPRMHCALHTKQIQWLPIWQHSNSIKWKLLSNMFESRLFNIGILTVIVVYLLLMHDPRTTQNQ